MSLNPRSKQWYELSSRRYHRYDDAGDRENLGIPSMIVVPQRSCRVTSSMEQIYREMPASINEEGDGSSSKPWQVDLARKTYTHSRRFRRTKRVQPPPPPLAPPTPASPPPPVATISFQKETPTMMEKASPGLHVPRTSGRCDGDDEYPSDEECGFGGGCVSRSSSSPSSSYMGNESPTGMQGSRPARSYLYFYRPS